MSSLEEGKNDSPDIIKNLSPELKAIADEYLDIGYPPKTALEFVEAYVEIQKLPLDLQREVSQLLDQEYSLISALNRVKTLKSINELSPGLRAVANEYLESFPPETALNVAIAQGKINDLSPDLQAVAKKYIDLEYSIPRALEFAKNQGTVNALPDNLREFADQCLARGSTPTEALNFAFQESLKQDLERIAEIKITIN